MTAEAAIQNMAFGHQFLWNTFGVRPKYGWQVDPFGAAALTAAQFAMLGFQGPHDAAAEAPERILNANTVSSLRVCVLLALQATSPRA